ncbi:GlxA family transcriptional regulator [Niveispirillum sp. KHB5.9]|uniref:GlxA family transcriptional regulator n=1 Tax=Niveispirillum sp. KHB5.9 TaxID=3400269 RepID=UPI003A8A957A
MAQTKPLHIAFAMYEDVNFLDVGGPLEAFWLATNDTGEENDPRYRLTIVSLKGGQVRTSSGMLIETLACSALGPVDTVIIPGGGSPQSPKVPEDMVRWIAEIAPKVRRLCSVCTGAFLLAAAGQLDGRTATTHWAAARLLRKRAPTTQVEDDRIYLRDGNVWTCAGVTAGIDLALALIEDDYGFEAAMDVARYLVVYLRRPGSQSQFSKPLSLQAADDSFAALHAWIRENLAQPLTVERMAEVAGMSVRTFSRRYRDQTGRTPARAIAALRLEAAQNAMERGTSTLKRIARDYGFGDERNLRRALQRESIIWPGEEGE